MFPVAVDGNDDLHRWRQGLTFKSNVAVLVKRISAQAEPIALPVGALQSLPGRFGDWVG